MDYLKRIRQIAELTGQRQEMMAPRLDDDVISLTLEHSPHQVHYVVDTVLAQEVFQDSESFAQDRFLDQLLETCPGDSARWLSFFVRHSPEFLDGEEHSLIRKRLAGHFEGLLQVARSRRRQVINAVIPGSLEEPGSNLTSLNLAELFVRGYFTEMLSGWFGHAVAIESSLLFGPDIFTPTMRLKSSLLKLNRLLDTFINEQVPQTLQADDSALLAIITLFLMATSPVTSGLTCLFNAILRAERLEDVDLDGFRQYVMAPTNFVARRCRRDRRIGNHSLKANDTVYVMLFESTGCPFSGRSNLAFGRGRHFCLGTAISKEIMASVIEAMPPHLSLLKQRLQPSELAMGLPSAFLPFQA